MSHFTTAVFSRTPADMETQLAPYEEGKGSGMPKWDWYAIGGSRFEQLHLKDGSIASRARVNEIDFSRDEAQYQTALKHWDDLMEVGGDEAVQSYTDMYGSSEAFADMESRFAPFAFVDADGVWHERGEMGWFGFSTTNGESLKAFMAELDRILSSYTLAQTLCNIYSSISYVINSYCHLPY